MVPYCFNLHIFTAIQILWVVMSSLFESHVNDLYLFCIWSSYLILIISLYNIFVITLNICIFQCTCLCVCVCVYTIYTHTNILICNLVPCHLIFFIIENNLYSNLPIIGTQKIYVLNRNQMISFCSLKIQ